MSIENIKNTVDNECHDGAYDILIFFFQFSLFTKFLLILADTCIFLSFPAHINRHFIAYIMTSNDFQNHRIRIWGF